MNENMVHIQILDTYKKYFLRRMIYDILSVLTIGVGILFAYQYIRNGLLSQMSEADRKAFIDFACAELKNSPVLLLIGILIGVIVLLIIPKCISAQVRFFEKMKRIKTGQYSVTTEVVKHNFALQKKIRSAGEGQRFRVVHYYRTEEHPRINIVNGFNFRAFPGQKIYVITFHEENNDCYPDGVKVKKIKRRTRWILTKCKRLQGLLQSYWQ